MGKAHSGDLRARVYGEIAGGGSRRAAARRPGTSASTGVRLAQRMAVTGPLARRGNVVRLVGASWRRTGRPDPLARDAG